MKNILFEQKTIPFSVRMAKSLWSRPHFHKDIEVIYVINGASCVCADRKKDEIRTGDIFISFPNQIHYYERSKQGEYLLAIFSPDILFELKDIMYENIPKSNVLHGVESREFVKLLVKAFEYKGEYSKTVKAGILNQAMAMLLPELEIKRRIRTNNATIQEILNYCASNFTENITLDDVAGALHISKYHISHLMNDQLGLSFVTYLNGLRIEYACDLLEDTDKKIADISEDVGFSSIRSFNRAFGTAMNMSPSQYRIQFNGEKRV